MHFSKSLWTRHHLELSKTHWGSGQKVVQ
jgi:hypothetical protein